MLTQLTATSVLLPLASLGILAYIHWWWSILKHWLPISSLTPEYFIETNTSTAKNEIVNHSTLAHKPITSNLQSISNPITATTSNSNTEIRGMTTLIPFRNEALRIQPLLDSLTKIQAPVTWEIIFCDDHSNDNSLEIIKNFIANNPALDAKIIELPNTENGKKSALSAAIAAAQYEIIHTTDADCRLHPNLYSHLHKSIQQPNIELVLGRVEFTTNFECQGNIINSDVEIQGDIINNYLENPAGQKGSNHKSHRLLQQYQLIENTALIALGYSEFLKKNPAAANGANLMFKKSAFLNLGGYSGNTQYASGDDVFTLEKFILHNPNSVAFCTHPQASVVTVVESDFALFKNQRIRWMKKTFLQKTQKTALKQTFMGIFLLGFWVMAIEAVLSGHYESMALLWLGKLCVDAACVSLLLRTHPQKPCLPDIILCSILQVFWLPTLGLLAANKQFSWKGRSHSA
jgi:cellulose synthase/poly-beta-1,6-N-acetylglucosamine synthase-like glycosyltransferase